MGLLADIFGRKDVAPAPEPSLTDAERSASLREQLHDVQTRMGELNIAMRDFRTQHQLRVDGLCQVTGMRSESLSGWKDVELAWRVLVRRRDVLMREFNRLQASGSVFWARSQRGM
jgi:hypothetical protein